ncbi:MAG: PEP-CTERM sorting domain-containing protein [Fimbriimonas sp.]
MIETVPEPASIAALAGAIVAFMSKRRRPRG